MGESSMKMDLGKLNSYCDDLDGVLMDRRDTDLLTLCSDNVNTLRSSCDTEFAKITIALQDYESKIESCRKKTEAAKSEVVDDEELDLLRELEEENRKERLLLEELRAITDEINDKERTRIYVQTRKQTLKKLEQDEINAQKTLSMLASVTNIIPDLSDPSKVAGHIVDRDKKTAKKFEFDSTQRSAFDICDDIWKMIGP